MRSWQKWYVVLVLILLCTSGVIASPPTTVAPALQFHEQLRERIRNRLESYTSQDQDGLVGLRSIPTMKIFYEKRGFEPAWVNGDRSGEKRRQLVQSLEKATLEGLNPREYHLEKIQTLTDELNHSQFTETNDPVKLINLELLMTDAFFLYGRHLLSGRIAPEDIHPEWVSNKRTVDFPLLLEDGLSRGEIETTLSRLPPSHTGYRMLRKTLADYRLVRREVLPPVELPQGRAVKRGDKDPTIQTIRKYLQPANSTKAELEDMEETAYFDEELENAVRRFQYQHGLEPDGVIGPQTIAALNTPFSERIEQIILNMERWRWLPQDLGPKHIIVNIADYTLQVIENDQQVLDMKVVVGRDYRRTPVFSDTIRYLVLNPSWHVPSSIAVKDKLPLLRKDPEVLRRDGYRVFQRTGDGLKEVDMAGVNWNNVTPRKFPYAIRQDPGPANALGTIKFMFPNRFNVYLHDTSSRELFNKSIRRYSSGCVRLEKPLELAAFLLQDDDRWTMSALQTAIASKKEQTILLKEKVPIHILYLTAFADQSGTIQFRPDIYGRDALLEQAW